jgi:hypothetical protein
VVRACARIQYSSLSLLGHISDMEFTHQEHVFKHATLTTYTGSWHSAWAL